MRFGRTAIAPVVSFTLFLGWTAFSLVEVKVNDTIRIYNEYATAARQSSLRQMYDEHWVEYPPLAVGLLLVTGHATEALSPVWSAVFPSPRAGTEAFSHFGRTYGLIGCVIQAAVFAGLWWLCRRTFPAASPTERAVRVGVFVVGSILMANLVHQRLDATLAALVLLSLACLHFGRWVLSFLVLAAAIAFKLVPAAVAPLWVLASLPGTRLAEAGTLRGFVRLLPHVAIRGTLLVAFVAAWVLPFYLTGGPRSFAFLEYHRHRGIHTESSYGTLLLLLRLGGHPVESTFEFGCQELHSPLSPLLGTASSVLLGASLLAACALAFVGLQRAATNVQASAAQVDLGKVVGLAVLSLMTFAACGKVFSPQFALWVIPLVSLLPLVGRERWWFFGLFLVACLLTRLAAPAFAVEMKGGGSVVLTTAVLVSRTVLWFGLMGWLGCRFGITRAAKWGG